MVGSVLLRRMHEERDFDLIQPAFFSTSQAGQNGPDGLPLQDANNPSALADCDMIISCQGGDYTKKVHPELRKNGWKGHWIDAASALRMHDDAVIVLDPVNRGVIDRGLADGKRDFIGGNCTVSLLLMATHGLYDRGWVEWVNSSTYQAASGAGAQNMRELLQQMGAIWGASSAAVEDPATGILDIDKQVSETLVDPSFPKKNFTVPLAANVLPWIDSLMEGGETREEWKGHVESNKILGNDPIIPVDGICVRVGALRSHSQAVTIKLKQHVPLPEVESILKSQNQWVRFVGNEKPGTLENLTPASTSGNLDIAVGRLRYLKMGSQDYLSLFTCGDQLLWGAAEPLRRIMRIIIDEKAL